jgi:hypothetical protein
MDQYKLKIKIGDHEFEAEGPVDIVNSQFAAFKELVGELKSYTPVPAAQSVGEVAQGQGDAKDTATLALEKIMRKEGRVVSLTAKASTLSDSILLVIFGQKMLRNNDSITGGEIIDGLKQSGQVVNRIDYILEKIAADGNVLKIGIGRASRYRLTNQGMARAQEIARDVLRIVA